MSKEIQESADRNSKSKSSKNLEMIRVESPHPEELDII